MRDVLLLGTVDTAMLTAVTGPVWGVAVVGVTGAAAGLIIGGLVVHRPARWAFWVLVAGGLAVHGIAAVALTSEAAKGSRDPLGAWPAIAVAAYPALFVGVGGITSRRASTWSTDVVRIALAVTVGTLTVLVAVTLPYMLRSELPLDEDYLVGALALGDGVLAMMAARRVVGLPRRNWSWWLLTAGFVAWGNAHAEVGTRLRDDALVHGPAVVLLMLGPILIGLAGLLPSMGDVPDPRVGERGDEAAGWARWLVLPPLLLVIVRTAELDAARLWVTGPAAVVMALAVSRTASLAARPDIPSLAEPNGHGSVRCSMRASGSASTVQEGERRRSGPF